MEKSRLYRDPYFDGNVHAVLYVVSPTGHSLTELDIHTMLLLSTKANIIPIIGRSDSFTVKELKDFKQRVRRIPIY